MTQKELVCIGCPMGCNVTVKIKEDGEFEITGNTCNKGADYAKKELTAPRRIVTSTVRVKGGEYPVVSVKTATDIPKDKIFDCMETISKTEVEAPVAIGDIIIKNVAQTEVDIIATKNCGQKK